MFKMMLVTGEGCANCEAMRSVSMNVAKELNISYEVKEVNQELIDTYEINGVPTVLLIHNNELVDKVKGFQPEEILQLWIAYKVEEASKKGYNVNV